ncbi:MAG TPA: hypothetical protein VFY06_12320 [Verrucomicrobiae bacterium]|nr:hypothetical protein [Verrucomicrobiae bacterium]
MPSHKIPKTWEKWCSTGTHKGERKRNAILKSIKSGDVRGYFSDIPMRPELDPTHSMYPSFEHLVDPSNHQEAVVEARIINDMKSHLSENEFWMMIEHLFVVGLEKRKIKPPFGKRLPKGWEPMRHYVNKSNIKTTQADSAVQC